MEGRTTVRLFLCYGCLLWGWIVDLRGRGVAEVDSFLYEPISFRIFFSSFFILSGACGRERALLFGGIRGVCGGTGEQADTGGLHVDGLRPGDGRDDCRAMAGGECGAEGVGGSPGREFRDDFRYGFAAVERGYGRWVDRSFADFADQLQGKPSGEDGGASGFRDGKAGGLGTGRAV